MSTDVYSILDDREIACLASARRQEIIDAIVVAAPLSAAEIAEIVGIDAHAVYHHLRKLMDVGLVVECGERRQGGRLERTYGPRAKRLQLRGAFADPAKRPLIRKVVEALARQLQRDALRGCDVPGALAEGPLRNAAFVRYVAAPTDEQLREINRKFDEIAEILQGTAGSGPPGITIGWITAPMGSETKNGSR